MECSAQLSSATSTGCDPQKFLMLGIQLSANGRAEMIGDLAHCHGGIAGRVFGGVGPNGS
jgi:hypothetical protein